VKFQNFSNANIIRYLWDFGDGSTSILANPTHVYNTDGVYTITLNIVTSTGAQGIVTKNNYITANSEFIQGFWYVEQQNKSLPAYSQATALQQGGVAATFLFIDQTTGEILQRFWDFGDGESISVDDPNIHTATHIYAEAGEYSPTLLCTFTDQTYKRIFLSSEVTVL
jgi:PKD repeat protein